MFCTKCGAQLPEGAQFCTACGAPVGVKPAAAGPSDGQAAPPAIPSAPEQPAQQGNILVRLWNSPKFGWAAILFDRALYLILVLLGVLFLFTALWPMGLFLVIFGGLAEWNIWKQSRQRAWTACPNCGTKVKIGVKFCTNCGAEIPVRSKPAMTAEAVKAASDADKRGYSLTAKKISLLCAPITLPIILMGFVFFADIAFNTPAVNMKSTVWDQFGPQTLEQVVDANFDNPEWSSSWIDDTDATVYVEGYMPSYGQDVRLTFHYQDVDDETFSGSLDRVDFLGSGEAYTDLYSTATFMEQLYDSM